MLFYFKYLGGPPTTRTFAATTTSGVIGECKQWQWWCVKRCGDKWCSKRWQQCTFASIVVSNELRTWHNNYIESIAIGSCSSSKFIIRQRWFIAWCSQWHHRLRSQQCDVGIATTATAIGCGQCKSIAIFANAVHAAHIRWCRIGTIGTKSRWSVCLKKIVYI